jgi:trimeric autotransporter adhesin
MKKLILSFALILLFWGQGSRLFAQSASYFGRYAGGVGINQNNLQRASAIGYNAKVSVDDALILGDTSLVKVGIGLSNPRYRLDVKGVFNMRTAYNSPSFKINDRNFLELDEKGQFVLNSFKMKYENEKQWSDRVFEENYFLLPLKDVEKFIAKNNHLPNVPSATEVVKNGVAMDEMVSKLLEKVEELTLYTIQQQKEIDALKKDVKNFKRN